MRRRVLFVAAALAASLLVAASQAEEFTVLYEFEVEGASNAQGWGSFGPNTTDSGATTQSSVGTYGRFHSFSSALLGWGIVSRSPVASDPTWGFGDLNPYLGISADVKLTYGTPPTALNTFELMLAIGDAEWTSFHTMTGTYQTFMASFDELIPQGTAVAPITAAELADPNLQIKLVVRRGTEEAGKGALRYDHVCAWVPEPSALALLAVAGLFGLRRR